MKSERKAMWWQAEVAGVPSQRKNQEAKNGLQKPENKGLDSPQEPLEGTKSNFNLLRLILVFWSPELEKYKFVFF